MEKFTKVALVGSPNVGKSTLINKIIGYDLSIITPKVQTTRNNIYGISNIIDNVKQIRTQIVFIDTPGLFDTKGHNNLEKYIVNNAWLGIKNAEFILFIFSITQKLYQEQIDILEKIKNKYGANNDTVNKKSGKLTKKLIALINKIDIYEQNKTEKISQIQALSDRISSFKMFEKIFPISAISGEGIEEILDYISYHSQQMNWEYDEALYTNESERSIAEEITREQLYLNLHNELPYSVKVETDLWLDNHNSNTKIHQSIFTLKNSQKSIIIGERGEMIKKIGQSSREKISRVLGRTVHLFLFVKTREDWIKNLKLNQKIK